MTNTDPNQAPTRTPHRQGIPLTATEQPRPTKALGKTAVFTGTLAVIGCMLACSLPLIAAGGALAGLGALLAGWWPVAVLSLAAGAGVMIVYLRRRKAATTGPGCDCGGTC